VVTVQTTRQCIVGNVLRSTAVRLSVAAVCLRGYCCPSRTASDIVVPPGKRVTNIRPVHEVGWDVHGASRQRQRCFRGRKQPPRRDATTHRRNPDCSSLLDGPHRGPFRLQACRRARVGREVLPRRPARLAARILHDSGVRDARLVGEMAASDSKLQRLWIKFAFQSLGEDKWNASPSPYTWRLAII
jgi:hypothetical protein